MTPARQLVDWHTHCFLPEHLSPAARSDIESILYERPLELLGLA